MSGITAYREISRDFALGDRIQFTSTNRELGVSNRDLGTIDRIDGKQIDVKMDGERERTVSFDSAKMRHFDRGYTVTSHSSQGLTTDRVLVNMDTTVHPELINTRFAEREDVPPGLRPFAPLAPCADHQMSGAAIRWLR